MNANTIMMGRQPEYTARTRKKKRRDVDVAATHEIPHTTREVLRVLELINLALVKQIQMQYARLKALERRFKSSGQEIVHAIPGDMVHHYWYVKAFSRDDFDFFVKIVYPVQNKDLYIREL